MNGRYLLDTNAIIYYLRGDELWVDFIDNANMTERFASVITRMELLSWQSLSKAGEIRVKEFLSDVIVVPLDGQVEANAVDLRRSTGLKLPDAIIVATALAKNASVITDDQRIVNLSWPGLRTAKLQ